MCRKFGSDPDETGAAVLDLSGTGHLGAGQAAWTAWVDIARAAIEEMREPTDAMVAELVECVGPGVWRDGDEAGSRALWRGVIDVALAETA